MGNDRRKLWGGIALPRWDADALWGLYLKHAYGTPSEHERNDLVRQLMVLVAASFARHGWIRPSSGGREPDDLAADVLAFVCLKLPKVKLERPCVGVLLNYVHRMIFNRFTSITRRPRIILVDRTEHHAEAPPSVDVTLLPSRLRDAEDRILGEINRRLVTEVGRPTNIRWLQVLYRFLGRQVMRQNAILSYSELPPKLRERIDPYEEHSRVSFAINEFIRDG